jgi:hypothetical protein
MVLKSFLRFTMVLKSFALSTIMVEAREETLRGRRKKVG